MSGYGMKGHIMCQFQNSFGTALTTSLSAIAVTEANFTHTIEQIVEQGMYGRFDESPYHSGAFNFEGDMTLEASPIAIGWAFKSIVGFTSTVSGTGTQTHVFKPRASDFDALAATDPMTIQQYLDVGSAMQFSDMCGNTLAMNIANGELLSLTAGFVGGKYTRVAAGTPVFPTAKPFKWDQFSGSFGGAAINDILDLSININNNLEARHTLQNTAAPRKIKRSSFRTIELTGTMLFQAHSYYNAFLTQTNYSFVLNFAGQQSPNNLKIDFPSLRMKTFEPTIRGPGVIEAPFTAQAEYDASSATAMQITLVNTQEGYLAPVL